MKLPIAELRRGDYVWLAHTWPWPVVYHDRGDRDDREITVGERTALMAGWAFTRCGIIVSRPLWEEPWSTENNRFAMGPSEGHDLPLRLLNPTETRPCQRCFILERSA